jgi:hypothetical protein
VSTPSTDQGAAQKAEALKSSALRAAQWKSDLTWIMEQEAGRRFLGHFIRESRKRIFTTDQSTVLCNLGRHEFLRELLDQLRDVNLALFQKIEREISDKQS